MIAGSRILDWTCGGPDIDFEGRYKELEGPWKVEAGRMKPDSEINLRDRYKELEILGEFVRLCRDSRRRFKRGTTRYGFCEGLYTFEHAFHHNFQSIEMIFGGHRQTRIPLWILSFID